LALFWPVTEKHHHHLHHTEGGDYDEEYDDVFAALDSVVKIHATHSEPDYTMPWQRQHQTTSTSSGFAIFVDKIGFRIMTNAHSVEYGSIIQVQRRGDEHKYQAQVDSIANECDLALLKVESDEFWYGLKELEFGELPILQDEVEVLGFPTGGDALSITSGVVSRIEMQEYTQADTHLLAIQIDAAINAGNSGGPVVDEDQNVVGVAFQALDGAENIGYVVPVTVVQHFLEDIRRNGKYTGFCEMGVGLSMLENKTFRNYLGMEKGQSGVMVRKVSPIAPAAKILQENDVILAIDDISVANDGKIFFRPGERVSLLCYTQTKFAGDELKLNVLRNGKEIELMVPVDIGRRLVPGHWNNQPPPYMIISGLVFTALSAPLLYAINAWEGYVSDNVSYLLQKVTASMEEPTDEVVVLVQVLAHSENLGYDQLSDLHLAKFNGEKVKSLKHLLSLVMANKESFIKFEFAPHGTIVVMERSSIDRVTTDVCDEHRIQEMWNLPGLEKSSKLKKKAESGAA
jgi:S1-C subfamily serine protease